MCLITPQMTTIVHSLDPVTLIGGGEVGPSDLDLARSFAPRCVAADGGASVAMAVGIYLDAVVGDFDSLDARVLAQIPVDRRHHIPEQNSTDFDKCLRHIAAPVVVAVGFSGGRLDHQMAAMHTLVARADRPCVILGTHEVVFHCPPQITLPTQTGDVVSLFPLSEVTGTSTGLEWPIDGLKFAPDRYVGTSNRAVGPLQLTMSGTGMLCIVPRRMLGSVIQALVSQRARATWPAPAG
jgi:thiamine pyrophosphokinase